MYVSKLIKARAWLLRLESLNTKSFNPPPQSPRPTLSCLARVWCLFPNPNTPMYPHRSELEADACRALLRSLALEIASGLMVWLLSLFSLVFFCLQHFLLAAVDGARMWLCREGSRSCRKTRLCRTCMASYPADLSPSLQPAALSVGHAASCGLNQRHCSQCKFGGLVEIHILDFPECSFCTRLLSSTVH